MLLRTRYRDNVSPWYSWWQRNFRTRVPGVCPCNNCYLDFLFLRFLFRFYFPIYVYKFTHRIFRPLRLTLNTFPDTFVFIPFHDPPFLILLLSLALCFFAPLNLRRLRLLLLYAHISRIFLCLFQPLSHFLTPYICACPFLVCLAHDFSVSFCLNFAMNESTLLWFIAGIYIYITVILAALLVTSAVLIPRALAILADIIFSRIQHEHILPPPGPQSQDFSRNESRMETPPPPYEEIGLSPTVHFSATQHTLRISPNRSQGPLIRNRVFRSTNVWYVKSFLLTFILTLRSLHHFCLSAKTFQNFCAFPLQIFLSMQTFVIRASTLRRSIAPPLHGKTSLLFFFAFGTCIFACDMANPKLKRFESSDPIEWDVFLRNFKCYVGLMETAPNDKKKKGLLLCHLDGQAAQKAADLYDYIDDDNKTYAELVRELTQIYSPAASGDLAHGVWQHCRQERSETIETWHTRCKMLYKRAFPDDTPDTSLHLIRHFIEHLYTPEYRPNVMLKRPQTYSAALKHAQEVVAAISVNDPKLMREAAAGAVFPEPIKQEVHAISPYRPSSPYRSSSPGRFRSPSRFTNSRPPPIVCHYCGQTGHVLSRCLKLEPLLKFRPSSSGQNSNFQARRANSQSPNRSFRPRSQSPGRRFQSPSRVSFNPRPQVNSIHDSDLPSPDDVLDAAAWEDFFHSLDDV